MSSALTRKDLENMDLVLDDIEPKLIFMISRNVDIFKLIPKYTREYQGEKELRHQVLASLPNGAVPALESDPYDEPSHSKYFYFKTGMKESKGRMVLSFHAIRFGLGKPMKNNIPQIKDVFRNEMENFLKATSLNETCLAWGNGTGQVGQASGSATGYVIPVHYSGHFRKELYLTVVNSSTGKIIAEKVIVQNVDNKNSELELQVGSVTPDQLSQIDENTVFYFKGIYSPAVRKSPLGIMAHISDTNPPVPEGKYQDVDRDLYPGMQAILHYGTTPGTPENFSDDRVHDLAIEMKQDYTGEPPSFAVCNDGVYKHITGFLKKNQMLTNPIPTEAGTSAEVNIKVRGKNIPHHPMEHTPKNAVLYFQEGAIQRYLGPSEWIDFGYGKRQVMEDHDFVQSRYHLYREYLCRKPKGLGAIYDVNEGTYV